MRRVALIYNPASGQHSGGRASQVRDVIALLRKAEIEIPFQQRIDGQDQRLDHVVQEMGKTDGAEYAKAGFFGIRRP